MESGAEVNIGLRLCHRQAEPDLRSLRRLPPRVAVVDVPPLGRCGSVPATLGLLERRIKTPEVSGH